MHDQAHTVIARRLSNALIPNAEADFGAVMGSTSFLRLVKRRLNSRMVRSKRQMGGLWVGGETCLTKDAIIFRPNAGNQRLHRGDMSVVIPLADIVDVKTRFGVLTRIADIITPARTLSIRCFGLASFVEMIAAQRSLARTD